MVSSFIIQANVIMIVNYDRNDIYSTGHRGLHYKKITVVIKVVSFVFKLFNDQMKKFDPFDKLSVILVEFSK
jgi:hypothetical protein